MNEDTVGAAQGARKPLRPASECPICSNFRSLGAHLIEMADFCLYLGDTAPFNEEDGVRDVRTEVIGDWLRLASQLKRVEIDTWKYAGDDGFYCETVAENLDADAKHYSTYATSLTRFIFVCNGLEEAYRFVAQHYDQLVEQGRIDKRGLVHAPGMKAAYLIDQLRAPELPTDLQHIARNLSSAFEAYQTAYSPRLSGLDRVSTSDASYALHLVRNLRNHIAHGVFPLVGNLEESPASPEMLHNLLFHACRVATLYIQSLLGKYCDGFHSYEYKNIVNAHGEEFDRFIKNCTIGYSATLHLKGKFTLSNWMTGKEPDV